MQIVRTHAIAKKDISLIRITSARSPDETFDVGSPQVDCARPLRGLKVVRSESIDEILTSKAPPVQVRLEQRRQDEIPTGLKNCIVQRRDDGKSDALAGGVMLDLVKHCFIHRTFKCRGRVCGWNTGP